jgi:ABC-type uncharacterized transport system substrate-binding protein
MRRRDVLIYGALGAIAPAWAQQAAKVRRVGVLHPGSSKESASVQREPFERGLRELGWVPGSTVTIDYRYAEGDPAKVAQLAAELVLSGAEVIVARGNSGVHAMRKATSTVPIVMAAMHDPVVEGVVKNLSRPGGNVTGIALVNFELDGKRIELMKEAFPGLRRLAVLANPDNEPRDYEHRMAALRSDAHSLKLQAMVFEARRKDEIDAALESIGRERADALLVRGDPLVLDHYRREIASAAVKHRLPLMSWWRFVTEAGGLMSYGESIPWFHHRSASFVSRILKGANAGDLAIERPTKFELVVNLKTAKALGVEMPKAMLFRADELIQ